MNTRVSTITTAFCRKKCSVRLTQQDRIENIVHSGNFELLKARSSIPLIAVMLQKKSRSPSFGQRKSSKTASKLALAKKKESKTNGNLFTRSITKKAWTQCYNKIFQQSCRRKPHHQRVCRLPITKKKCCCQKSFTEQKECQTDESLLDNEKCFAMSYMCKSLFNRIDTNEEREENDGMHEIHHQITSIERHRKLLLDDIESIKKQKQKELNELNDIVSKKKTLIQIDEDTKVDGKLCQGFIPGKTESHSTVKSGTKKKQSEGFLCINYKQLNLLSHGNSPNCSNQAQGNSIAKCMSTALCGSTLIPTKQVIQTASEAVEEWKNKNLCNTTEANTYSEPKRIGMPTQPKENGAMCQGCKKEANFLCSACRGAHYCSLECQRLNWVEHSRNCAVKK